MLSRFLLGLYLNWFKNYNTKRICNKEFAMYCFCSHIKSLVELESVIVATAPLIFPLGIFQPIHGPTREIKVIY